MKGVNTTVTTTRMLVRCSACNRSWQTTNALAVGARHAAAYRHLVVAETATTHVYAPTGGRS